MNENELNTPAQAKMRELVSSLPEDSLSLAWRSSLNERLLETSAKVQRKRRIGWVLRPAFGLAFAGALAAVVMIRTSPVGEIASNGGLEAALVQDHRQSTALSDMAGVGVNPLETRPTVSFSVDEGDWAEIDLNSL